MILSHSLGLEVRFFYKLVYKCAYVCWHDVKLQCCFDLNLNCCSSLTLRNFSVKCFGGAFAEMTDAMIFLERKVSKWLGSNSFCSECVSLLGWKELNTTYTCKVAAALSSIRVFGTHPPDSIYTSAIPVSEKNIEDDWRLQGLLKKKKKKKGILKQARLTGMLDFY